MSLCVTVTGPPRSICRRKIGITLPDEPSTLPNRTATKRVETSSREPYAWTIHSPIAFDWPSRFFGCAALSVETSTKRFVSNSTATSASVLVGEDVVAHRLERVRLEQRHVLVRGSVEDDVRTELLEDLADLGAVADVREHGQRGREAALADELALDLEQRRLGVVDEDDPPRADARDLTAELGADRPARARDEHGLAREVAGDLVEIDLDRLAAEDVLDLHGTQLAGEVHVAGDELVQARQRLDRHALLLGDVDDSLAQLSRGGRHRDQHLVGLAVSQHAAQLRGRPEHADAVDPEVLLARVVVEQADRRVAEVRRTLELAQDQLSRVAGADDDDLAPARHQAARRRALDQRAREEARPCDEREQQEQVDQRDAARQPRRVLRRERVQHEVDEQATRRRRRARRPTCRASRRSATSGCRSRRARTPRAGSRRRAGRPASRAGACRTAESTGRSGSRTSAATRRGSGPRRRRD